MLRDDSGNGEGGPKPPRNVLGERLEDCSIEPDDRVLSRRLLQHRRRRTSAATRSARS